MDDKSSSEKDVILRAALPYIAEKGWHFSALIQGAADKNIPAERVYLLFEGKMRNAVCSYNDWIDRQTLERLQAHPEFTTFKVHQKIRSAVVARLQVLQPHKEVAKKTAIYLSTPAHASLGTKLLFKTTDLMWRAAGDTATDFNYYTKRGILAGVYGSTLAFWLRDSSPDLSKSITFLDNRLKDSAKIPKIKGRICEVVDLATSPIKSIAKRILKM